MIKILPITPKEEILVQNCHIGIIHSIFTCDNCPYEYNCTEFMEKYEAVPQQTYYSHVLQSYFAEI